jgi:VCBS repeat-containing protein
MQVINNRVSGNFGDRCMQFKGISNSRVVGNSVEFGQSDGIEFENGAAACTRVIVAHNDVRQCNGNGIFVQRGSHFTITGNHCWANASTGGMRLGGISHSTIKGNLAIANATNGIVVEDNNAVASVYNLLEGNIVRDDGSGVKGSDGSALTQSVSITLTGSENNNTVLNNQVSVATAKVGAATTITGDIVN